MPRSPDAASDRPRFVLVTLALAAGFALTTVALASSRFARAEPTPAPPARPAPDLAPAPAPPPPLPPLSTQQAAIADELGRSIDVYPPLDAHPGAPLIVFLHATCMDPRPVCDLIGDSARAGTFLVCPSGNDTCFGAPDWHGSAPVKSAFLTHALEKVDQRWGKYIAHDDTLFGWSRGAFAARDILYDDVARGAPPRFSSLVLMGADVSPDPVRLRAAGIRRVLFAAGDQDGARPTMKRAAVKLSAAGIPSRYVSLGPIGHWWPTDFGERMTAGLAWVREK